MPNAAACNCLQAKYGDIHNIYLTNRTESLFIQKPIPKHIRDPDSEFSQYWDLVQIIALLYVTVMVPLRSGFVDRQGEQLSKVEAGSLMWWLDLFIDLYFFVDFGLTFMTAYWLPEGVMEVRPIHIAKNCALSSRPALSTSTFYFSSSRRLSI